MVSRATKLGSPKLWFFNMIGKTNIFDTCGSTYQHQHLWIKDFYGFLRCVRTLLYLLAMQVNQFHHFSPRKFPMVWDELRVEGVGTWDHICLAQHLTVDTLLGPHKEKPCRAGAPESKEAKPTSPKISKRRQHISSDLLPWKYARPSLCVGRWVSGTTNRPVMALFNLWGVTSSWPFGLSTSTCVRSISSPMSLSMLTPSFSTCAASTLDVSWSLMILRRVKLSK